jgi:hypothetical protein
MINEPQPVHLFLPPLLEVGPELLFVELPVDVSLMHLRLHLVLHMAHIKLHFPDKIDNMDGLLLINLSRLHLVQDSSPGRFWFNRLHVAMHYDIWSAQAYNPLFLSLVACGYL